jgi:putative Holliday junction resolvase
MGRILAIDYGLKKTGLAVTDPLKIIASPLETIATPNLLAWLKQYVAREELERIVVGMPTDTNQSDTHTTGPVKKFVRQLYEQFPNIPVTMEDERFTSIMAKQAMISGGMKKKERRNKENVDKISAAIILQSFMGKNRI